MSESEGQNTAKKGYFIAFLGEFVGKMEFLISLHRQIRVFAACYGRGTRWYCDGIAALLFGDLTAALDHGRRDCECREQLDHGETDDVRGEIYQVFSGKSC